jgi:YidC/Oxa1 family membrane protein insertase
VGTIIKPKEEKVKKVTGKDLGSRRRKDDNPFNNQGDVIEVEPIEVEASASSFTTGQENQQQVTGQQQPLQMQASSSSASAQRQQGSRGGKGSKFKELKAKEAASRSVEAKSE